VLDGNPDVFQNGVLDELKTLTDIANSKQIGNNIV